MVHAYRYNQWDDDPELERNTHSAQNISDWNSLRGELENLLSQVHLQSQDAQNRARTPNRSAQLNPNFQSQFQQSAPTALDRHSQALASVQRAVDRFSEPEEAIAMPAQSQHQLQNAIRQIRSSQRGQQPRGRSSAPGGYDRESYPNQQFARHNTYREPARQQTDNSYQRFMEGQFEGIGGALENISDRMERFEHAIGGQNNSDDAVADMAMQVEQLSGVVEHLANNIGERGQIKRLENQIAKMADAIPSGQDLDFVALNKRLDVLSGAFEKLRDLQAQQVELNIKSNGDGGYMDSIEEGVRNIYDRLDNMGLDKVDLEPVENCVRTVYDRIDALEQTMAMPTPAIERLSREMADFTMAMRDEDSATLSADLIAQVGGLVNRIEQIETEGAPVGDLKVDIKELQSSVVEAMEPRFAALENKIVSLSGKLDAEAKSSKDGQNTNATVATLEKHIRALAVRLDKTSSELNGLQKVFRQQPDGANVPDLNGIAEMVAQRTSQAMEKLQARSGQGLEQKALDQLEGRLSKLFSAQETQPAPLEFNQVQNSIEQVNQRLARLESSLRSPASKKEPLEPKADASRGASANEAPRRRAAPQRARHPGLSGNPGQQEPEKGENWEPSQHLIPELRDNMPRPPAQDGPLKAPVFEGAETRQSRIPVPSSLRVDPDDLRVTESEVHEIDEPRPPTQKSGNDKDDGRIKLPKFTDENVTPPPAPASSFAPARTTKPQMDMAGKDASASTHPSPKQNSANAEQNQARAKSKEAAQMSPQTASVSRSTFIEAARRAAQTQNADAKNPESNSLIARAMARFQKKKDGDKSDEPETHAAERNLPGSDALPSKYDSTETKDENENAGMDDLTTVPESFLTRHRQPILLGAAVIAVSLLTLNLVSQRFSNSDPEPAAAVSEMATPVTPSADDPNAQQDGAVQTPSGSQASDSTSATSPSDQTSSKSEKPDESTENSGDVVGSIDRFSGNPDSTVRVIDPDTMLEMPDSLDQSTSVRNASLNSPTSSSSLLGLEMPPEAIGPELLRQTAADGDARAQFEIAAIFAEGRTIPQDLASSAIWYERAAAQGFAPASYRLANMLENGVGVTKDLSAARLWYQLAADAGNRMSMHNLASLLASGHLGEQQFESAAHWFEKAASLGLKDSQFNLGMLYARGLGVTQSLENSFKWFSIAANSGDADAAQARDDIARSLDAQIVARLQGEVQAWEPAAMNIRSNFAPIGTWSDDFDPGPEIEAREVIIKVQAALNGIGFDTGIPDGLIGPKTIDAISGFEVETGMIPSGKVNPRLLAVLGSQPV